MMPTVKVVSGVDRTGDLRKALRALTKRQVLVGVPQTASQRRSGKPNVTNAMLAYVHDNGSPARGIPAREFLRPGIKDAQPEITERFGRVARVVLDGDASEVERGLMAVGLVAQKAVRRKITTGPFAPLKPATIRVRKRRGRMGTRPLIDTGALRQSINFVVRDK